MKDAITQALEDAIDQAEADGLIRCTFRHPTDQGLNTYEMTEKGRETLALYDNAENN